MVVYLTMSNCMQICAKEAMGLANWQAPLNVQDEPFLSWWNSDQKKFIFFILSDARQDYEAHILAIQKVTSGSYLWLRCYTFSWD